MMRREAHRFTVVFEQEAEGGQHVFCPTLSGCHTQSETIEEKDVLNIREAIELNVETLIVPQRISSSSQSRFLCYTETAGRYCKRNWSELPGD